MKNKKGFTLVELLAVIAILSLLVIIALPNVMSLFNEAKKNSFLNECKQIFKTAQNQWMTDSLINTDEQIYSRCDTCVGKGLKLSGREEVKYYVRVNKGGKIVEFYVTDGTYQFLYDENDLKIEDINDAQRITSLNEDDIITINPGGIVPEPHSFETDSWKTIANAVRNNNTDFYNIGDTKPVDMGDFGSFTARLVNKSTPDVCSEENFSQSSCGFVIEFKEMVRAHRMNSTNTVVGGWEASEMRQYVNTTVFSKLPSDLQSVIASTHVSSSFISPDTSYFYTTDKLFLPSPGELGFYVLAHERKWDYYELHTGTNFRQKQSKYDRTVTTYWTRTPCHTDIGETFYTFYKDGKRSIGNLPVDHQGIALAFKIE